MKIFGFNLPWAKKRRKRKSGYATKTWTVSETNTMLRLRSEGHSWREIGEMLNRTGPSCSSRYYKVKHGDKK